MSLSILVEQPATAAPGHQTRATTATPPVYIGEHKIRTAAIVDRGYLLVPVRGVFEAVGASVEYSSAPAAVPDALAHDGRGRRTLSLR